GIKATQTILERLLRRVQEWIDGRFPFLPPAFPRNKQGDVEVHGGAGTLPDPDLVRCRGVRIDRYFLGYSWPDLGPVEGMLASEPDGPDSLPTAPGGQITTSPTAGPTNGAGGSPLAKQADVLTPHPPNESMDELRGLVTKLGLKGKQRTVIEELCSN